MNKPATKILPFVQIARPEPTPPLPALGTIAIENIAEWFNGGETNRKAALDAADEIRIARYGR